MLRHTSGHIALLYHGTVCRLARCPGHPYMIGRQMNRLGMRSRALWSSCAYLFAVSALIGGAICGAVALSPIPEVNAAEIVGGKIGPGYGRMKPIDLGKPEKVIDVAPYRMPVRVHIAVKQARPHVASPARAEATLLPPPPPPSYLPPERHDIF
jgi:hypothetical protein